MDGSGAPSCRTGFRLDRHLIADQVRGPAERDAHVSESDLPSMQRYEWDAYEKFPDEILRLLVKALGEVVFKLLDLLPVCQSPKDKPSSDRLIYDAT